MRLIIGVGNTFRNDDSVGRQAALALRDYDLPGATILEASGEGATLMELWQDATEVILIDATCTGQPPGTISCIDPRQTTIPAGFFHYSSHSFGVAEAIALAQSLGTLPPRLLIYGIEGSDFGSGQQLSPPVERAMQTVINHILEKSAPHG